ncbi:MAG: hypothetical protein JJT75_08730 [Opitutales bacterium]|nr:hypothetical protein [Opitutales bacterium]MCH8539282.1 hypothetical protein [Opitutales bacterium]
MITWLQTRFQKGYQLLFLVLLAIVIVAFVFTIGAQPSGPGGRMSLEETDFFGYNLQTRQGDEQLQRRGFLSHQMRYGVPPQQSDYFYQRVLFMGLGREIGLQPPEDEAFARFIRSREAFQDQDGRFRSALFQEFLADFEDNPNITEDEIFIVLAEDYIAEKTERLMAGPGHLRDSEIRRQLAAREIRWTINTLSLEMGGIRYEGEPQEEDLRTFYEENLNLYEIPTRKTISYTVVEAASFAEDVEDPGDSPLRQHFQRHSNRFPDPRAEQEENGEDVEHEEDYFELVRGEVLADYQLTMGRRAANRFATELAVQLWDVRNDPEDLETLLEENDLSRTTLEPVRSGELPTEVDWPQRFVDNLDRLTEDRPISDPMSWNEDYVILFLDGTIPPSHEEFEDIRDRVEEDFREDETRALQAERSTAIRENLSEGQDSEDFDWEAFAEEHDLTFQRFEDFSQADNPEGLPRQILFRLTEFRQGDLSEMIRSNNTGYFLYIDERRIPEDFASEEEIADRKNMMKEALSGGNAENIAAQLIRRYAPYLFREGFSPTN